MIEDGLFHCSLDGEVLAVMSNHSSDPNYHVNVQLSKNTQTSEIFIQYMQ